MNPTGHTCLEWDIPEFGLSLRLRHSALEDARQRSVAALKCLRRRGLETGGVLVGALNEGRVEVAEFREVTCAHLFGPTYRLTDEERSALFSNTGEDSLRPIAFWRSNLRDQSVPDAHDTVVAREAAAPGLILLLHPSQGGDARLVCCVPDADGVWQSVEAPEPLKPDPQAIAPEPTPEPTPELAPAPKLPRAPDRPARPSKAVWWIVGAVAALIGALLALTLLNSREPQAAAPEPYVDLGFRAERAGADIRLAWNARQPVVAAAHGGVLRINDNGVYRTVDLNAAQTRAGSLVYSPRSGDIEFRLEIYGAHNRSYGEGTRVILPLSSPPEK